MSWSLSLSDLNEVGTVPHEKASLVLRTTIGVGLRNCRQLNRGENASWKLRLRPVSVFEDVLLL